MHYTPKKTLKRIKQNKCEAILAIKKNQKDLYRTCLKTFEEDKITEEYTECDDGHGRGEIRHIEVCGDIEYFNGKTEYYWGEHIKKIFKVTRIRMKFMRGELQKQNHEQVFYLSTMDMSAKKLCEGVRGHWKIENQNHYVKDVTMGEDKSRIRVNAGIFARLRSFGLNLVRSNGVSNVSDGLYKNALNIHKLLTFKGLTA